MPDSPLTFEDSTSTNGIGGEVSTRLNWLRAAMLGANDGIVSVASLLMGLLGATQDNAALLIAGVAGLLAGAFSMAAGEYFSVSTQRDSEEELLAEEQRQHDADPQAELEELAQFYEARGVNSKLALEVARELSTHDALRAHAEVELGLDPDAVTSPWHAAWASMVAFTLGGLLPLLVVLLTPEPIRVAATLISVTGALALTGWLSTHFGYGRPKPAMARSVILGLSAMLVTYGAGALLGIAT